MLPGKKSTRLRDYRARNIVFDNETIGINRKTILNAEELKHMTMRLGTGKI